MILNSMADNDRQRMGAGRVILGYDLVGLRWYECGGKVLACWY